MKTPLLIDQTWDIFEDARTPSLEHCAAAVRVRCHRLKLPGESRERSHSCLFVQLLLGPRKNNIEFAGLLARSLRDCRETVRGGASPSRRAVLRSVRALQLPSWLLAMRSFFFVYYLCLTCLKSGNFILRLFTWGHNELQITFFVVKRYTYFTWQTITPSPY